jgi:cob(I)alamin adenosyltransferase
MGNRLTKIYTKKGDDGSTDLGGNQRVPKYDQQIEVYGSLDELSAAIGILVAGGDISENIQAFLINAQQDLFNIAGELSAPKFKSINEEKVEGIEVFIDSINSQLPPLKEFVVPGANLQSARAHLARAICRRAERELVKLADDNELAFGSSIMSVNPNSLKYLNRLSDAFFVVARKLARDANENEIVWDHERQEK